MSSDVALGNRITVLDRSAAEAPRRAARVLVVDDSPIVRYGLRQLFAADPLLSVVGEAASPRDALVVADRVPPDLLIVDLDLGRDAAGIDLARLMLERHRGVRVLLLTARRDRAVTMRAMRAGVHGYLRKTADTAEIQRAAHALLRGESVFDAPAGTSAPVTELFRGADPRTADAPRSLGSATLTERENQVLRLLAVGMSNREIGRRLVISEATVKFHVRNLRDKLEVRRRTEIVYTATRQGIV
ncbi:response regulator [Pseudonocardia sp. CA-107938]|uniref:response regulator n=1 Tax=Pseudonocardia sp. CA-107938 TaxID=3240021 RepID=UPI003D947BCC